MKDDSEGDDFEPADGDLDDEDEDEEAGESEEGLSMILSSLRLAVNNLNYNIDREACFSVFTALRWSWKKQG